MKTFKKKAFKEIGFYNFCDHKLRLKDYVNNTVSTNSKEIVLFTYFTELDSGI